MSHERINISFPNPQLGWLRYFLPTPGNVIFTLILIVGLLWAQNAGALTLGAPSEGTSTGTIAYQGRLADSGGNPLSSTLNMSFRLYSVATGGSALWTEQRIEEVRDGLFNAMLGSLTPIPQSVFTGNSTLFLGITAGTDAEMTPRVQLGSVPWAVQALTVPDESITMEKLAAGAVTTEKISNNVNEPSRIQTWIDVSEFSFSASPTPPAAITHAIIDPGLIVTVPPGKAYYYIVTYSGRFYYAMGNRKDSSPGFYASWGSTLLSNDAIVGTELVSVQTGISHDWGTVGQYWTVPYQATWVVRLEEGVHNLTIDFHGYSNNTMNSASLFQQALQVMRVY